MSRKAAYNRFVAAEMRRARPRNLAEGASALSRAAKAWQRKKQGRPVASNPGGLGNILLVVAAIYLGAKWLGQKGQ